ncbi:MAG: hypothetical protein K2Q22_10610, partial [Cytophagales bacterium]|nr:hypothetical protein [Cytophagales bacterium]
CTFLIDAIQVTTYVPPVQSTTDNVTILPTTKYQTMVGFGGALTWFCPRVVKSPKKAEIINLLFNDLGADIIRFKNWYYPANYPADKTTNNIEGGIYWKDHLTATAELHALAKAANPNVQTLMCSWNPPSNLKSNGKQEGGTLKKGPNGFMYNEFATYWNDVLDNVGFNPDYISIQNEPGFTTSGWGTCQWRPSETTDFPGYDKALDAVYNTVKNRPNLPKFIGPETENIGSADWNNSLNLYREFAKTVKSRPFVSAYAFHPYNFNNNPNNLDNSLLNIIKNEFNDRPTFMTEFASGNFKWLQTADAIQTMLVQSNISSYIFWQMMWVPNTDAMIEIDDAGNYTVGNQYYAIKHFSKYIDKDYKRISVANVNPNVKVTGFMSPDGGKITLVYVNNSIVDVTVTSSLSGQNIASSQIYQSDGTTFFQNKGAIASNGKIVLPKSSLTTVVLNVVSTNCQASLTASGLLTFCSGGNVVLTANAGSSYKWYQGTTLLSNTSRTLTVTATGQYYAQVAQSTGCSASSSKVSVNVLSLPSAVISTPATSFCEGSSITLTASTGSGFKWYNSNVLIPGNLRTQTVTTGGSYTVEVTNSAGCKAISLPKVVTLNQRPVLIPNL